MMSVFIALTYGATASAGTCMRPAEQQAFDVIALKSSLMVGALSCSEGEQYDAFMTAFQPYVMAEQRVMDDFFHRAGGLAGQAEEDDYVTLLANTQSASSIAEGAGYCHSSAVVFTKVSALQANLDLQKFADAKPAEKPFVLASCGIIDHSMHHRRPDQTVTVADNQ